MKIKILVGTLILIIMAMTSMSFGAQVVGNIYSTDIKAELNGKKVDSYKNMHNYRRFIKKLCL